MTKSASWSCTSTTTDTSGSSRSEGGIRKIAYSGGGARTSATGLAPLAAIVVDVTHATYTPGVEKQRHGDVALGAGAVLSRGSAVNPRVFDLLVETAEAEGIPYVVQAAAGLLAAFARRVTAATDFVPG